MVVYTINPNTLEAESGWSPAFTTLTIEQISDQLRLPSET